MENKLKEEIIASYDQERRRRDNLTKIIKEMLQKLQHQVYDVDQELFQIYALGYRCGKASRFSPNWEMRLLLAELQEKREEKNHELQG